MSETTVVPTATEELEPSWSSVMQRAFLRPHVATYQMLVNEPGATTWRALVWYFIGSLIGLALVTPVQAALDLFFNPAVRTNAEVLELVGTPQSWLRNGAVGAAFWLLIFICAVGLTQLLARFLGGQGSFQKFAYVSAAIWAPLTALNPLSFIPVLDLVMLPLSLYGIVLNFIALKAVNGFGWGRTILAGLVVAIVTLGLTLAGVLLGAVEWAIPLFNLFTE